MVRKIERDANRFKQIVRGKIKQNLKKYIQKGEMVGKQGKEMVTIPLPTIDIPHFKFGAKQQGGVGQGPGDIGQQLGPGQPGDGDGKAGEGQQKQTQQHRNRLHSGKRQPVSALPPHRVLSEWRA